jgi:hypothetical protein
MAGFGPAIHDFIRGHSYIVDARHKAGHDEENYEASDESLDSTFIVAGTVSVSSMI